MRCLRREVGGRCWSNDAKCVLYVVTAQISGPTSARPLGDQPWIPSPKPQPPQQSNCNPTRSNSTRCVALSVVGACTNQSRRQLNLPNSAPQPSPINHSPEQAQTTSRRVVQPGEHCLTQPVQEGVQRCGEISSRSSSGAERTWRGQRRRGRVASHCRERIGRWWVQDGGHSRQEMEISLFGFRSDVELMSRFLEPDEVSLASDDGAAARTEAHQSAPNASRRAGSIGLLLQSNTWPAAVD